MSTVGTISLFFVTAIAEIVGCYLPYLWMRGRLPGIVLIPAFLAIGAFVWLLTLHPTAAGRTYAAYGGVYVVTAVFWLWGVERQAPSAWDLAGCAVTLAGMALIAFQPVR